MSWSWLGYGSGEKTDNRNFEVVIYEEDYKELCAWVLRKPHIETGGDLFGLWADKYNAVIQFALGPGKRCRRTSVSFYQDVDYLAEVGSYLTQNEGVCHIGEWHSHHQLGLARPSGGDENTVWNNMPTYNLTRFVIFIANIDASHQNYNVNIGCFLFEIDSNGYRRPVLPGKFKILHGENLFSRKKELNLKRIKGEEEKSGDEFDIDITKFVMEEEKGKKPPFVTMKRPETKKRYQREDEINQQQPKRNKRQPHQKGTPKPQPNQCDQEETNTSDKREGSEGKPRGPTTDESEVTGQKKEKGEDRGENESAEKEENVEVRKNKQEEMKQTQEERKEEEMETDDSKNQRNDKETENEEDNSKRDDDLKNPETPASACQTMMTVKDDDKQISDEMAGSAAGTTEIPNEGNKQGPAESAQYDSKKTKKENQTKITEIGDTQRPAGSPESVAENAKKEGDKQGPTTLAPGEMNTEAQSQKKGKGDEPEPAVSAESVAEKTEKEDQTKTKEIDVKQGPAGSTNLVAGEKNTEDQSKTKEIGHKQSPAGSDAEKTKKEDQMKSKEIGTKQKQAKSADLAAEKTKKEDQRKTTEKGVKQGSTAPATGKMKIEVQSKATGKGSAGSAGPTGSASGKAKREIQTKTTDKTSGPQNGKGGSKRPGRARKAN